MTRSKAKLSFWGKIQIVTVILDHGTFPRQSPRAGKLYNNAGFYKKWWFGAYNVVGGECEGKEGEYDEEEFQFFSVLMHKCLGVLVC